MSETLIVAIRDLAEHRRVAAESAARVAKLRADFEAGCFAEIEAAKRDAECVRLLEDAVRGLVMDDFMETGDVRPAPGVEVKQFTKYTYDEKEALAWALEHRIALTLDKKVFERIGSALDFVEVTKEPRAQIATNLDKALAVAAVTAPVTEVRNG